MTQQVKTCKECSRSKCIVTKGVYRCDGRPDYCAMDPGERVFDPANGACEKATPKTTVIRHCLKCERSFRSRHGLRLCDQCRTRVGEVADEGHSLSASLSREDQHVRGAS